MIQIGDTITILDIVKESVSPKTVKILMENHTAYTDNILSEDIINIHEAIEAIPEFYPYYKEVQELQTLANTNNASYIRFI